MIRKLLRQSAFALGILGCLFTVSSPAHAGYTTTKYPIVLIHGWGGWDSLAGFYSYFYGIPLALEADGADVYVLQVSAVNSTETRGEQALEQIQQILAATGAEKVNLIGHSHGGPTSRYVAGVRPDLVASVTAVGAPNWGVPFADAATGLGSFSQSVVNSVTTAVGTLIDLLSGGGQPQSSAGALASLSTPGMNALNAQFPGGLPSTYCGTGAPVANGVRYYSWGGDRVLTNGADASDAALIALNAANTETSDGAIPTCSMHLGQFIKAYHLNHLDEINQLAGLSNVFETNPITIYRQHANRLQQAGL
ncbi:Lactonizing lipase precursor [compost metagenome]|uniref:Triacylglycerol lipase n=2 Tax=Burkholderiaceae TaxID=119060 RepID=A0AAE9HZD6_9BURK|nr:MULTISPECIES: triacylglycerol lipase [Cupriavidus]TSP11356.1 triacylglycerol lipase [Cupriavidus campinensis]URF03157.1 triacylglycerol lipase [Cupriavidus campinensis]CAG2154237.1 Triacylglycerol lipase [Cupriavidus campinensis]